MKYLENYTDHEGFIGHHDKHGSLTDFGDSTQRTFSAVFLSHPKYSYVFDLVSLISKDEDDKYEPVRHWNKKKWFGQRGSMSRDNFTPLLIVCCTYGLFWADSFMRTIFKRGGFLWNTVDIAGKKKPWYIPPDWIGCRNIATYLRYKMLDSFVITALFYVPLMLLDIPFFLQCVLQVVKSFFEKPGKWNTTDDLNLGLECLYIRDNFPTPVSYLGELIYFFRRPAGDDNGRYDLPGPYSAWKSYFRHPTAPPMYEFERLKEI